jgi:hypothetical protein
MQKFDVMRGPRLLAQVFYLDGTPALKVRDELIGHKGYPPDISVYRHSKSGRAFDDMARHSHPEECRAIVDDYVPARDD